MPKPRIPDPSTVRKCERCGKPIGGKGYYGPGCMGHELKPAREVRPGDPWAPPPEGP